jgi:hypothetical protein
MMRTYGLVLAAALVAASGGAMAQSFAPPPLQVEPGPPPPIPGPPERYELVPGHWAWNGVRYVWHPRHWILRPVGYAHWVPGHWGNRYGRYVWIEGHWAR